jgi:hypothetical protein
MVDSVPKPTSSVGAFNSSEHRPRFLGPLTEARLGLECLISGQVLDRGL